MKKQKRSFFDESENNPKTVSGKIFILFILFIILSIFVSKCNDTYSGYDWYPGKAVDETKDLLRR